MTRRILFTLSLTMAFCFCLTSLVQAGANDPVTEGWAKNNLVNKKKAAKIPIWQITQEGTASAVNWVNTDNPRFAIYDSDTEDQTDDLILDRETGLVWERSPDTETHSSWTTACNYCYLKELANRKGFRPPTIEELASLVDNDIYNPPLPPGHPFINMQPYYYWSSTTWTGDVSKAWAVVFSTGYLYQHDKEGAIQRYVWCVRGGQGHDGY